MRRARLGLSLSLCLAACAHAPPTPDAQEVDSLTIEGTHALKEGELKKHLATGESSWLPAWVPFLGRREWFDPTTWQADLRRIARYYEAHGYYQARVLDDAVTPTPRGHVKLRVRLHEGDPARIASLELRGLDGLSPEHRAQALEKLPLEVGEVFLEAAWRDAKQRLTLRLRELGYAEAAVTGEAVVDVDATRVELTLEAAPGLRYRFGKLFAPTAVTAQVPSALIRDEAQPEVTPGDWYTESALAEAQARVFQMGVFGAVKVTRGIFNRELGTVDTIVDTREAPFRSVRLGGGLGFDLMRNEARGTFEYVNRNLGLVRLFNPRGLLDKLTVKARLGVAVLPSVVALALADPTAKVGPFGRVLTEYEVPRIFGLRTLALNSSLDLARALDPSYDYWGAELKVGFVWRPRLDLAVFPSLNLDTYLLQSAVLVGSTAPTAAIGCPLWPQPCTISYAEVTAELDRRDNRLEPRQGFYAALSLQGGLSQTSRLTPFTRLMPELRGYYSFGQDRRFTVAARCRLGLLLAPGNETPIIARFFSGGASAMRGFNQQRLSPLVAVPGKTADGQPDYAHGKALPIGGSGLLEASLELRWALNDDFVLALFSDSGLVTVEPLAGADLSASLYSAVGVGVRYLTALGPLRLDLGFRLPFVGKAQVLTQASTDPAQAVAVPTQGGCYWGLGGGGSTTYGGAPENLCTVHLSIGEAF